MANVIYNLVFSVSKKNPMPIDISVLDDEVFGQGIEAIDIFTSKYTNDELMQVIRDSNILTEEYLNGELCIIDNKKHKYPVLLKDFFLEFSLYDFIASNIDDKNLMNSVYNIFIEYTKSDEDFNSELYKKALLKKDVSLSMSYVCIMPYIARRRFEFYCFELYKKLQKKKELKKS